MGDHSMDVLIDHATISRCISDMARAIEADLEGETPILVGILKGSIHSPTQDSCRPPQWLR